MQPEAPVVSRWSRAGLLDPRVIRALLAALVVLLLTACAEGPMLPTPAEEVAESAAPETEAEPDGGTDEGSGAGDEAAPTERDPLADLAEGAAADLPGSTVAPGTQVLGGDISWPNCPVGMGIPERPTLGLPMPLDQASFVIVGLTNGPGFTPNPCLAEQVAWVRERQLMISAYAVVSYPHRGQLQQYGDQGPFDGGTTMGALANVGHAQATQTIASMRSTGLTTPFVWLDVETVKDFDWVHDTAENAAVIRGAARAYTDAGYRIGVYSTPYLWERIAGDLSLGGVPEWRAAGPTSREEALKRCGADWSIQGGTAVLGQWVVDQRDLNVTCPGAETRLGELFHQL